MLNSLTPPLWAINNKDMKSKEEILDKYLKDNHGTAETYRDILKAMKEYAQQSQPSGMRWVRVEDYKGYDGRILVFSPIYPVGDPMRYRIIDSQFLKTCKDVSHYYILNEPSESSPAGAAEGVKRYETVVNDTGFDKSSEHYVNNVFMRNANVWSDEYDWMMTKDRFVDVVSLFFTTTQPASEGMAEALRLLDTASNLVGNP